MNDNQQFQSNQQQHNQQQGFDNQQQAQFSSYPAGAMAPKTNGKAVPALVLGILAIVIPYVGFILGIIAIVFGKKAMNEIKVSREGGHGMAVAGFVMGIIGTALYAIVIFFVILAASFFTSTYYYYY